MEGVLKALVSEITNHDNFPRSFTCSSFLSTFPLSSVICSFVMFFSFFFSQSTLSLVKSRRHKWFAFSESYDCLKKILPALVTSMPSEEPPVIKLLEELTNYTVYSQWQYTIHLQVGTFPLSLASLQVLPYLPMAT